MFVRHKWFRARVEKLSGNGLPIHKFIPMIQWAKKKLSIVQIQQWWQVILLLYCQLCGSVHAAEMITNHGENSGSKGEIHICLQREGVEGKLRMDKSNNRNFSLELKKGTEVPYFLPPSLLAPHSLPLSNHLCPLSSLLIVMQCFIKLHVFSFFHWFVDLAFAFF